MHPSKSQGATGLYAPIPTDQLPQRLVDQYEANASKHWDMFYKRNATNFFKDRHYLDKEFPELATGSCTLLEVGCGVGNTVYPLLQSNPQLQAYACDFSPIAVSHVQQHPQYSGGRITAFVADITSDDLTSHVPPASVDFCTMVFVLSAIAPERMSQALRNVRRVLRPGTGRLLLRDYAEGDLAQERLEAAAMKRLGPSFYVRGDGTRCYYFKEEELKQMLAAEGFTCDSMCVHQRQISNRKRQLTMHRRWLQATFTLDATPSKTLPLAGCADFATSAQATSPSTTRSTHASQQLDTFKTAEQPATTAAGSPACSRHAADKVGDDSRRQATGRSCGHTPATNWQVDAEQPAGTCCPPGTSGQQMTGSWDAAASAAHSTEQLAGSCSSPETSREQVAANSRGGSGTPSCSSPGPTIGAGWMSGAAGRLAAQRGTMPGVQSGRALLPESLDPADEELTSISPSAGTGRRADIEAELERDFFATVSQATEQAVAAEIAAASRRQPLLQLWDVHDVQKCLEGGGLQAATEPVPPQQPAEQQAVTVELDGVRFRCRPQSSASHQGSKEWTASLDMACHLACRGRLLQGRCVLVLEPPGGCALSTLAALRWARRVYATSSSSHGVDGLVGDLSANSCRVVIERVRCRMLDILRQEDVLKLLRELPGGFDVIVAPTAPSPQHEGFAAGLRQLLARQPHTRLFAPADVLLGGHGEQLLSQLAPDASLDTCKQFLAWHWHGV